MYYLYILSVLGLSATGLRLEAWQVASTNGEARENCEEAFEVNLLNHSGWRVWLTVNA